MPDHNYFANLIWQIADLLRGPYRPPQYERVMLPMTVLRRFACVLAPTRAAVLRKHEQVSDRYKDEALDKVLNHAAGQRFHNHSPLTFEKLKGDPDNIEKHLVSYIKGFSANVRFAGRFGAGLPRVNNGSLLFLQYMISKFEPVLPDQHKHGSRLAIVFSGSPLFTGGAGSGESDIRKWIIENDWLEAIIALPQQIRAALIAAAVTGRIAIGERERDNLPRGHYEN